MPSRYRSFFWPAVLILAGLVALLVNTGVLSADRLYLLFDLWPVILIVIGLEIVVRRRMHGGTADLAAALVVVVAIAGAAGYVALAPNPTTSHAQDWSEAVGSVSSLRVEVDAGAATMTITQGGDVGSDLYRLHLEFAGPRPQVQLDRSSGVLRISQPSGSFTQSDRFGLTLLLNPRVSLAALTLNTGASQDDITVGPPSGMVPIQVNGGALSVRVHRPAGTQLSVDVSGGALSLDVDGHHTGAFGQAAFQTGDLGSNAYRIRVNGGACTVRVDTQTGTGSD